MDLTERRKAIKLFQLNIVVAHDRAMEVSGTADPHLIWHFFRPFLVDFLKWDSRQKWVEAAEAVLIPELEKREGWNLLVPDVKNLVDMVKLMESAPRWGCDLCY